MKRMKRLANFNKKHMNKWQNKLQKGNNTSVMKLIPTDNTI